MHHGSLDRRGGGQPGMENGERGGRRGSAIMLWPQNNFKINPYIGYVL
jgi:hypothetical protein